MAPAGMEAHLRQGDIPVLFKYGIVQFGALCALCGGRADVDHIVDRILLHVVNERRLLFPRDPREDGIIALFKVPRLHLFGKARRRLGALRKHHDAARRAVQPVHQPHIGVARLVVRLFDVRLYHGKEVFVAARILTGRDILRL